jgi:hypothetical protein
MFRSLNSPSKRVFALVMLAGITVLAVSMGSFFSAPYTHRNLIKVNRYYGWSSDGPGTGKKEAYYSIDHACAAPLVSAAVEQAGASRAAHLASKPTDPGRFAFPPADWTRKGAQLRVDLKSAENAAGALDVSGVRGDVTGLRRTGVRDGEVREQIKASDEFRKDDFFRLLLPVPTPSIKATPSPPRPEPTEAEKFDAALRYKLHLYGLPKPVLDEIIRICLRTGEVEYVLTSVRWSTDIGRWLKEGRPYSDAGIILTLVGFLGAFAQAPTRSILRITVGRLIEWVRKG